MAHSFKRFVLIASSSIVIIIAILFTVYRPKNIATLVLSDYYSSPVLCQIIFNRPMEETNSINLNEEETQLLLVKLNNTPIRYSASSWNGFRESYEYQFAIIIQDSRTGIEYANIIIRENGLLNVSNTVYRITQRHAQEELIAHLKTICHIFE